MKGALFNMKSIRNPVKAVFGCIKIFTDKLRDDAVSAYAANAAFFIIVSFFPFLILMITVINAVIPESWEFLLSLIDNVPDKLSGFVSDIFAEAEDIAVGTIVSIAAVSAIWAASKGFFALIYGLNTIAGTKKEDTRSYFITRSVAIIYTLGLIITLLLTLLLLIFGNSIYEFLSDHFTILKNMQELIKFLRYLFGTALLSVFFTILYAFIPNRRTKILYEIPGAVFSTVGWLGFSVIYSFYIENTGSFTVYGSLSAIVLLMLWLYFCMYIFLIGAEINKLLRPLFITRKERSMKIVCAGRKKSGKNKT